MNQDHYLRFNDITISLLRLRVWIGEQEVHFTLSELRLLLIFLEEPYKALSREELIKQVDLTSAGALQQLISRVRILLNQEYIFSEPGGGYSFAEHGRLKCDLEPQGKEDRLWTGN